MHKRWAHRYRKTLSKTRQALFLMVGVLLLSSCGEPTDRQQTSGELLLVYSGDFRGFFEPCG